MPVTLAALPFLALLIVGALACYMIALGGYR